MKNAEPLHLKHEAQGILSFGPETGPGDWSERYLYLRGAPAFRVGPRCETCRFLFERLEGAQGPPVDLEQLSERLRRGLGGDDLELAALRFLPLMPAGDYLVLLKTMHPRAVGLLSSDDYFAREQVELWGMPEFWGVPHDARVPYYLERESPLFDGTQLFTFLVPRVPRTWLSEREIAGYRDAITAGSQPTAVTLSTVVYKEPAEPPDGLDVSAHLCHTNFVVDGHHKIAAAADAGQPISVLQFVSMNESSCERPLLDWALGCTP
jgi:hypothetical protein